jgi:KaiC/GvpD/RAD55 family RecA-like ATPase
MNSKTSALLADPAPCSHIVYPYTDEQCMVRAVEFYASSGISKGEAVVLIVTEAHREALIVQLKSEAFNVERLQSSGQLVMLDASEMLAVIMADGSLDATTFKAAIKRIIELAGRDPASGHHRRVRLFGEMVSLLWTTGNAEAALRLEELWNEVTEAYRVALLCTYLLDGNGHSRLPESLLSAHSLRLAS